MNFSDFINNNIVILDGAMGTLLQNAGLQPGELPERWNISHPEDVKRIHKAYFDAGSNVVCTNTFGANLLKYSEDELSSIIEASILLARQAAQSSASDKEKFVALDIGPLGKLLKPLGDLDFEDAVSLFAHTARLGEQFGADLIFIETMNDSYETKAALLAAKESTALDVIVSNAYQEDGKLMTGASPEAMVCMLEGMGVCAIGANCSLGPRQLTDVAHKLLENASVPVILKPNAGLPVIKDGETVFDVTLEEFSDELYSLVRKGLRGVGGCCGTTPEHIQLISDKCRKIIPDKISEKNITAVSSYSHAVEFSDSPLLIGERINPTGKKRFKQALLENDISYILNEAVNQQATGVHILDVNVGLPDIDEVKMLTSAVCELQSVVDLPLQIDTSDADAMESALRRYNGKAMINSVSGKQESMDAVFPLVKKYGGVVVALTLDENGISDTAEGRLAIAEKILDNAAKHGIPKKDIIFDTLAMTVSADKNAARVTLDALKLIKEKLGCRTSLGVSNVSFGLPDRESINSSFFALALQNGLDAAIMNPYSGGMMKTYHSYKALMGLDENCSEYISYMTVNSDTQSTVNSHPTSGVKNLSDAVIKGFKEQASVISASLLNSKSPIDIINSEIVPALDLVGKKYEEHTIYLPQLLMSAEAAKSAFEVIKQAMPCGEKSVSDEPVILATVHGDIHDIGKNIVRLLLETYGFWVVDLGKDVPPYDIVAKTVELHAPIVGLSALMTTTVPKMEETIRLIKQNAPWCMTVVGGAVLTQEYADKIGADMYSRDAMDTVRFAENILKK